MAAWYIFPVSRAIFQDGRRHFLNIFLKIRNRSILAVFFMGDAKHVYFLHGLTISKPLSPRSLKRKHPR